MTSRAPVHTVLCDLDGVIRLGASPIPGAAAAVAALRAAGVRVMFVTNNSTATLAAVTAELAAHGIAADGDLVTSAVAAADLLSVGERVLVVGEEGLRRAVGGAGAELCARGPCDTVLVGLDREVTYARLADAAAAIRAGARFLAANTDTTFPTPDGLVPGGGMLVAALERTTGVAPVVAGKPHRPMAASVLRMLGAGADPAGLVMVGDRLDTDAAFAAALGCRFVLVRTGVTRPGVPAEGSPVPIEADCADLAAYVADLLGLPVGTLRP